ncbi:MAG: hypothetical protein U5K69_30170 [Balneolaceae bacterium]|nr:hypothetical protein [Balneolaceae bacterium]
MLPSIAIPGNHEYEGYTEELDEQDIEELSIQWRPQFEFPLNGPDGLEETTYYIDYQGVRIIGLNSNEQIDKQAKWLENVLKDIILIDLPLLLIIIQYFHLEKVEIGSIPVKLGSRFMTNIMLIWFCRAMIIPMHVEEQKM